MSSRTTWVAQKTQKKKRPKAKLKDTKIKGKKYKVNSFPSPNKEIKVV